MPTSVGEDTQASTGRPRSEKAHKHAEPQSADFDRRGKQVHLCQPQSERTPKPQWSDLGRRRHPSIQSTEVSTLIREGSKSAYVDLSRRGHPSLNGPTSVGEGTQASRASKCRLRSERVTELGERPLILSALMRPGSTLWRYPTPTDLAR